MLGSFRAITLACFVMAFGASRADACWFRTTYYCCPCPCPCPPQPCCVYHYLEPVIDIHAKYLVPIEFKVKHGDCVIIQLKEPSGIASNVKDVVGLTAGANDYVHYEGYSKATTPGVPGGPIHYGIFVKTLKKGTSTFDIVLKMTDGSTIKVPIKFIID